MPNSVGITTNTHRRIQRICRRHRITLSGFATLALLEFMRSQTRTNNIANTLINEYHRRDGSGRLQRQGL